MASTVIVTKSGRRIMSKILQRIQRGESITTRAAGSLSSERMARTRRRIWVATSAAPAVETYDRGTLPVEKGDLCYRFDDDTVSVCSTSVNFTNAGAFIQLQN